MSFRSPDTLEKPMETPSENQKMVSYIDTPFSDLFSDEEMVSFSMGSESFSEIGNIGKFSSHFQMKKTSTMKLGQILGIASISGKKEEAESDSTPTPTTPVYTGPSPGRVQTIIDTWRRTTGINL